MDLGPREFSERMHKGYRRTRNFRKHRLQQFRAAVGQYYDKSSGDIGNEPLNLIFNAIRTIVPAIVMQHPSFKTKTDFLMNRPYADMLRMALDYDTRRKRLKSLYRQSIVDAIFCCGILKTGLADSGNIVTVGEEDVPVGNLYTEPVLFDDFLIDPHATSFARMPYLGEKIRVSRRALLETGLYNNAALEAVPSVQSQHRQGEEVRHFTRKHDPIDGFHDEDEIEVAELWVPEQNMMVTLPWSRQGTTDTYLREDDYYGPNREKSPTGPYTILQFGMEVPGNPFNAAPTNVWYDLHVIANRLVKKVTDQAQRQKTIVGFRRQAADDAQEALDAMDGEAIAMDDPDGINEINFGGQVASNEGMIGQLQMWFNMMAANPQGISGQGLDAGSATEAQILQGNAQTYLSDMKEIVYEFVAEEAAKRAWFLHTDPFISIPLTERATIPAVYDPQTGMLLRPAEKVDMQVMLTPEARSGDWLDYHFEVKPESMTRMDSTMRMRMAMDFAVQVIPAAVQAAQMAWLMGMPFNPMKFITNMAEEQGIEWMDEVWGDPDIQMMMTAMWMRGPSPDGSQGVPNPGGGMGAILQNGQPANIGGNFFEGASETRRGQQALAAEAQRNSNSNDRR